METDYIKEMAEYILSIIRSGGPVTWTWGPAIFRPVEYGGMAALRFTVNGFIHKGDVVVAYNRGADTFEVYCLDRDDEVASSKNDVHLGELVDAIDGLVEKPGSDAEYDKERRKWLANNSITVHEIKSA